MNGCIRRHLYIVFSLLLSLAAAVDARSQQTAVHAAAPNIYAPGVPPVLLTAGHARQCKLRVGDPFNMPQLIQLDGEAANIGANSGTRATVVLFWSSDGWMSRAALHDLSRDVAARFDAKTVGVVGVAVKTPADAVRRTLQETGAKFPQLLDDDDAAFARTGTGRIPRIYVLDEVSGREQGKSIVAWFDIEYSEASRRELRQTLVALTKPVVVEGN